METRSVSSPRRSIQYTDEKINLVVLDQEGRELHTTAGDAWQCCLRFVVVQRA